MCKVIAVSNQKGGTAKSTSSVNLGIGLAREGKKVLLIDCDSQGSMSASLGVREPDSLDVALPTIILGQIKDVVLGMDEMRKEFKKPAEPPVADSNVSEEPQKPKQTDDEEKNS